MRGCMRRCASGLGHNASEARLMDIALVEVAGVVLVLVYVLRKPNEVRAISLRRASRQERTLYASWQETH